MNSSFILFLFFVIFSIAQDPNNCLNQPTCELCLQLNLCGWCADPVFYQDGSRGPRCAGKPTDPDNPPPGWKPWTCQRDFQNLVCYGYRCSNDTYQCQSAGSGGGGVPLERCTATCFPPTYECNRTDPVRPQCYQVLPGHGTDLPNCERQCLANTTTGSTGSTGSTGTTGTTGSTGSTGTTGDNGYKCGLNLTCETGGTETLDSCRTKCGVPPNNTPEFVIGDYRGLQIDKTYVKGEWQAKITANDIVVVDPLGQSWARGVVRQYENELWLVTDQGTRRGLFGLQNLPEVQVLTWVMGEFGQPPPTSFDAGLTSGKSFVFAKCLNPNTCRFRLFQALAQLRLQQSKWIHERRQAPVNDPCSIYPDCQKCITAPEYSCGWCSVNVVYNGSIEGKNCAGLNTTITPRFNCSGTFSTENCNPPNTTGVATGVATGQTTGNPSLKYQCNPGNATCTENANGTFPDFGVCTTQCVINPIPPFLQNKYWRGLEVDMQYRPGEWRAHISTNTLNFVTPDGNVMVANLTVVGQYITVRVAGGAYQTLWQYQPGPAVDNLSWAWGVLNGPPPRDFDEAMVTQGMSQFWFVTCHDGAPATVCDFSQ